MKSKKGITLVALIITIIVLLILAGVSISLVVGDNGVMTQAQKASKKTDEASARSALELTLSSITSEFLGEKWEHNTSLKIFDEVTVAELDEELQNNGFYIVKFGGDTKTENKDTTIDKDFDTGTEVKSTENGGTDETVGLTTTIVIAEGKPGTSTGSDHSNYDSTKKKAKGTTYTAKLKWTERGVTIIRDENGKDLEVGSVSVDK